MKTMLCGGCEKVCPEICGSFVITWRWWLTTCRECACNHAQAETTSKRRVAKLEELLVKWIGAIDWDFGPDKHRLASAARQRLNAKRAAARRALEAEAGRILKQQAKATP